MDSNFEILEFLDDFEIDECDTETFIDDSNEYDEDGNLKELNF